MSWNASDDRLARQSVDRHVMVPKYDSATIGLGQTGRRRRTASPVGNDQVELTMATAEGAPATGLIAIPRAVLSVAAGVVSSVERAVVGDARVRTARTNAFEAMCADRARAQAREETSRLVAALAASGPRSTLSGGTGAAHAAAHLSVGSSPRSNASQAALVSTGLVSTGPAARD
jgi:hypothetical protein